MTAIVVVGTGPAVTVPRDAADLLCALLLRRPISEAREWRTWAEWEAL